MPDSRDLKAPSPPESPSRREGLQRLGRLGLGAAAALAGTGAGLKVVAAPAASAIPSAAYPSAAASAPLPYDEAASAPMAAPLRFLDLQGHRGARGLAPENTWAAFERALAVGVTTLEIDTVVTADGHVVVHHDTRLNPDLTRDPQGRWLDGPGPLIRSLTLAELQRFDVGRARPNGRVARQFPSQQAADGQRVPTLRQVLQQARAMAPPEMRYSIEIKSQPLAPQETPPIDAFVSAVLREIHASVPPAQACVQSFDWRTLRLVHRMAPGLATSALTSQARFGAGVEDGVWTAGLRRSQLGSVPRMVQAIGARIWSPLFADVDAALVAEAHALGLKVAVWTVNDPQEMARQIDLGVDALITDYPDRARTVMQAKGVELPAAVVR